MVRAWTVGHYATPEAAEAVKEKLRGRQRGADGRVVSGRRGGQVTSASERDADDDKPRGMSPNGDVKKILQFLSLFVARGRGKNRAES